MEMFAQKQIRMLEFPFEETAPARTRVRCLRVAKRLGEEALESRSGAEPLETGMQWTIPSVDARCGIILLLGCAEISPKRYSMGLIDLE